MAHFVFNKKKTHPGKKQKEQNNKTERLRLLKEPQHHSPIYPCAALTVIHVTSISHRVGKSLWGRKSQASIMIYKGWWQTD